MPLNTTATSIDELIFGRRDWREELAAQYSETAERLLTAYERILPALREAAGEFAVQLRLLTDESGLRITAQEVKSLTQYQRLLLRVETEMKDFAALVRNEAGILADDALTLGIDASEGMTLSAAGAARGVIGANFVRPDPEALRQSIGYVDGEAMRDKFSAFGEKAAQGLAYTVLAMVAQGKNPVAIARMLKNWFAVPFGWATNMTRTVQLYSYRGANHATYAANGHLLQGWIWWSARDARTCLSCWQQHGEIHSLEETLNDHHRGRCQAVAVIRGAAWPSGVVKGPDLFEALGNAEQVHIMGGATWRAWKAGEVDWGDFSHVYQDDVYGDMLRRASLKEMLGAAARKYYRVR